MNILIACEISGRVRDAFRERGHEAWSCDLLGPDDLPDLFLDQKWPNYHLEGDVRQFLDCAPGGKPWDVLIAFPPCTYLCSSGLHWNTRRPGRATETDRALGFVCELLNAPIARRAIENPRGCISTRIARSGGRFVHLDSPSPGSFPATQAIQPYQFGEDASKETLLWLDGLMPLRPTEYVHPRLVCKSCSRTSHYDEAFGKGCASCGAEPAFLSPRWANQTDSGQNRLPPSDLRAVVRGLTYRGIADAMADQWS